MTNIQLVNWALNLGEGWHDLPPLDRQKCEAFCACHNMGLIKIDTTGERGRFFVRAEDCERYLSARI